MNILFTSSGRRAYLIDFFKNALDGDGETHACNSTKYVSSFAVADHIVKSPPIYSDAYIDFLLDYSSKWKIELIVPLFDIDLPVLAANRTKFNQKGIKVLVSDLDIVNVCNDKVATSKFLKLHDFSAPFTSTSLSEVQTLLSENNLQFPLFIKPRWGMGSIGIFKVLNFEELNFFYKHCGKKIFNSYLKYESMIDPGNSVVIQNTINGVEYGLDLVNDLNGNPIAVFVKEKLGMRAGETDVAITRNKLELIQFGMELAKKTQHIGVMDVDVFFDNKTITVIDMNARFGGGYPFSHLAGANIPKAIVCWMKGKMPDESCFQIEDNKIGVKDICLRKL